MCSDISASTASTFTPKLKAVVVSNHSLPISMSLPISNSNSNSFFNSNSIPNSNSLPTTNSNSVSNSISIPISNLVAVVSPQLVPIGVSFAALAAKIRTNDSNAIIPISLPELPAAVEAAAARKSQSGAGMSFIDIFTVFGQYMLFYKYFSSILFFLFLFLWFFSCSGIK